MSTAAHLRATGPEPGAIPDPPGTGAGLAHGADPPPPDDHPACRVHRTLVVDDVEDLRLLYRLVLERTGRFEVVGEAGDGAAAVELAGTLQPDLITMDVSMPGRDGLEVLPEILRAAPGARVVMVSGFAASRLGRMARERGAAAFLEKGLPPRRLVAELLAVMERGHGAGVPPASGRACRSSETPADRDRRAPAAEADPIGPEQLLAFVAHEIRNPLAVVQGFADTLVQQWDRLDAAQVRALAGRIAAQSRYLNGVVASMLHLRAIVAGELRLACRDVGPAGLLQEVTAALAEEFGDTEFEVEIEADLPEIMIDPERLHQVLANLVSNAVKHAPPGSPVRIRAAADGSGVLISVEDQGPGVPPDQRERVFERFVRLDHGGRGIGLGLYISRALVEAMDGRVWLDDAERGARACVWLPRGGGEPAATG